MVLGADGGGGGCSGGKGGSGGSGCGRGRERVDIGIRIRRVGKIVVVLPGTMGHIEVLEVLEVLKVLEELVVIKGHWCPGSFAPEEAYRAPAAR